MSCFLPATFGICALPMIIDPSNEYSLYIYVKFMALSLQLPGTIELRNAKMACGAGCKVVFGSIGSQIQRDVFTSCD